MRLMVIAALRAATIAITIQRNCFQVDSAERRVSYAQDELTPFLQHNVRGTCYKIVTGASRDFGKRADGAGNYGHRIDCVAAGGDCSANIFIGNYSNFAGNTTEGA